MLNNRSLVLSQAVLGGNWRLGIIIGVHSIDDCISLCD